MARKYPWDPKYIRRSDHFRFIAIIFLNLVYVFEERMKRAIRWCTMAPSLETTKIDGSKFLKAIKKGLGPRIRERGQYVHNSAEPYDRYTDLKAVEIMQEVGQFVEGWSIKKHGARATRTHLCNEIASEIVKVGDILQEFCEVQAPMLILAMKDFHDLTNHLIRQSQK